MAWLSLPELFHSTLPWGIILDSKKRNTKKNYSTKSKRTTGKNSTLKRKKTSKKKVKLDSSKVISFLIVIIIACVTLLSCKYVVPKIKNLFQNQNTDQKIFPDEDKLNEDLERISKEAQKQQSILDEQNKIKDELEKQKQEAKREKELLEQKLAQEQKEKEELEKKLAEEKKRKEEDQKALEEQKRQQELKAQEEKKKKEQQKTGAFNFPKAVNNAQVVFILDDGGQNLSQLEKFTSLPMPLTIAVLPKLASSKASAQKVRASGKELMLHQPMQSVNSSANPGPGAIKPDMSDSEIRALLAENLDEVGPVAGINNHEGSAITADAHKMEVVLKYASDNGVFFLDSRTNKDTQVPYVSGALGYSYFERNGNFLDNVKTRENALEQIRINLNRANTQGYVIMIGHVWSAAWLPQLLADVYPELKAKGYTVTTVSKCKGKK